MQHSLYKSYPSAFSRSIEVSVSLELQVKERMRVKVNNYSRLRFVTAYMFLMSSQVKYGRGDFDYWCCLVSYVWVVS